MPVSNGCPQPHGAALEADPDTKADVDLMTLDYLASFAAERIICPADSSTLETEEEIDWLVDTVRAFQTITATAQFDTHLSQDVDIKLRVLRVADALRIYTPAPTGRAPERPPRLASIGLEFMDLCATAISKVSETRWFDIGAQFLMQASLEELHEQNSFSDMQNTLSTWNPPDPTQIPRWIGVRQRYVRELPEFGDISTVRGLLAEKFPFEEFRTSTFIFLFDLMTTLDPPLLVQLERGQLGQLSRAETQLLKERIGMH